MQALVAMYAALVATVVSPYPDTEIRTRARAYGAADALTSTRLAAWPARPDLFAVALPAPGAGATRQMLHDAGVAPLGYLSSRVVTVWAEPSALARLLDRGGTPLAVHIEPAARIEPELWLRPPGEPVLLELLLVPVQPLDRALAVIEALGLEVLGRGPGPRFHRIVAQAPDAAPERLLAVAAVHGVFSVASRPVYAPMNDNAVWLHQVGPEARETELPFFDHGIHGEGQIIGVLDTGLAYNVCQFEDPGGPPPINTGFGTTVDLTRRKVIAYDFLYSGDDPANPRHYDRSAHGTAVAGSAAGDNIATPIARDAHDGMATAAKLVIQDAGDGVITCSGLPALGCPLVDLTPHFDQAWQQGARIHNNSWADGSTPPGVNTYSAACLDIDDFVWSHPDFLALFAVGTGVSNDTVARPSTAKNVVSPGSISSLQSLENAGSSARGWTADGRIKPHVLLLEDILSSAFTPNVTVPGCSWISVGGPSLATAVCSGLAALARQYFVDGFHPAGRRVPSQSLTPSAALLRAALIHGGRNLAQEPPMPSRSQGWGRLSLGDALPFPGPRAERRLFVADEAAAFPAGSTDTWSFTLEVLSSAEPLKVTLAWSDFPSNPLAATNLVNDLDLVVRGPSGDFLGNVFAGGVSAAGGSPDRLNVEEQVLIPAPAPGTYTVEVVAVAVPEGPQGFGLLATGHLPGPPGVLFDGVRVRSDALDPRCSDGDERADSGELVEIAVSVYNASLAPATAVEVEIASLGSDIRLLSPATVRIPNVAARSAAEALFTARVAPVSCQTRASFRYRATSAENAWLEEGTFDITLEEDTGLGTRRLDFESGLVDSYGQTWTAAGGFAPSTARAASGTTSYWAGWPLGPGVCDGTRNSDGSYACARLSSPVFVPNPGATLSLSTWYRIEAMSAGQYWDRANVHVAPGRIHALVNPVAGRPYQDSEGHLAGLCHLQGEAGWSDQVGMSWETSTFDLSPWAGERIQVEVNYNTNWDIVCEGIWVDDLAITEERWHACDGNTCAINCQPGTLPAQAALRGAKDGFGGASWEWSDPGSDALEYHVNSVLAKTDLGAADPASPRLAPRGRGQLECLAAPLARCEDPDALAATTPPLVFYQALAACGPDGADEGGL